MGVLEAERRVDEDAGAVKDVVLRVERLQPVLPSRLKTRKGSSHRSGSGGRKDSARFQLCSRTAYPPAFHSLSTKARIPSLREVKILGEPAVNATNTTAYPIP